MPGRGALILVVGPSGAGKDSIIAGAAERLRAEGRVVFARRIVTRPADAGGENHVAATPDEFARRRAAGGLLLHWTAHGLDYGLPQTLAAERDAGRLVVANVSRTVVAEARQRLAPVIVVAVTASPVTLAARLAARGRESPADVKTRLQRSAILPASPAEFVIGNDGALDAAVGRFVALIEAALAQSASS